jgi:hypothetical protein
MRRALATLAVLTCTAAAASGCGGGDSSSPSGTGSSAAPKVIQVTFSGDSVTPNGDRVEVQHGQPVELKITADAPGEIHVHSSPEQELEYDKGTSTLEIKPIRAPGIVDVESHTIDKTIVQLEVR